MPSSHHFGTVLQIHFYWILFLVGSSVSELHFFSFNRSPRCLNLSVNLNFFAIAWAASLSLISYSASLSIALNLPSSTIILLAIFCTSWFGFSWALSWEPTVRSPYQRSCPERALQFWISFTYSNYLPFNEPLSFVWKRLCLNYLQNHVISLRASQTYLPLFWRRVHDLPTTSQCSAILHWYTAKVQLTLRAFCSSNKIVSAN